MLEGINNIMEFKEGVDYTAFAENKLLKFAFSTTWPLSEKPPIS